MPMSSTTKRIARAGLAFAALAAVASAVANGRLYGTISNTSNFCAHPPQRPPSAASRCCQSSWRAAKAIACGLFALLCAARPLLFSVTSVQEYVCASSRAAAQQQQERPICARACTHHSRALTLRCSAPPASSLPRQTSSSTRLRRSPRPGGRAATSSTRAPPSLAPRRPSARSTRPAPALRSSSSRPSAAPTARPSSRRVVPCPPQQQTMQQGRTPPASGHVLALRAVRIQTCCCCLLLCVVKPPCLHTATPAFRPAAPSSRPPFLHCRTQEHRTAAAAARAPLHAAHAQSAPCC